MFTTSPQADLPKTRMFFSGKRLPLATLSSIDDHMSFFVLSSLFGRSWSLEAEICVYVDILLLEMAITAGVVLGTRDGTRGCVPDERPGTVSNNPIAPRSYRLLHGLSS